MAKSTQSLAGEWVRTWAWAMQGFGSGQCTARPCSALPWTLNPLHVETQSLDHWRTSDVELNMQVSISFRSLAASRRMASETPAFSAAEVNAHLDKDLSIEGVTSKLVCASVEGHTATVARMLQLGVNPNIVDPTGFTALHAACMHNRLEVAKSLLGANACPNMQTKSGSSPLFIAAYFGHLKLVQCVAASVDAKIDAPNHWGGTPLAAAARGGHTAVVEFLVQQGASLSTEICGGCSVLHIAAANGHTAAVHALVRAGAPVDQCPPTNVTALAAAVWEGRLEVVRALHAAGAQADPPCKPSVMFAAAMTGNAELVAYLLQAGAQYQAYDETGITPLYAASLRGHMAVVEHLVDAIGDVDAPCTNGRATALHAAAYADRLAVVKRLVQRGASVVAKDNEGYLPLHMAAEAGALDVVVFLRQRGSPVDCNTGAGVTAVELASAHGHVAVMQALLRMGAVLEAPLAKKRSDSPLHIAAKHGQVDVVSFLLDMGMSPNGVNASGQTPLLLAVESGHASVVRKLMEVDESTKATAALALARAACWGHLDVVRLLVAAGVPLSKGDETALAATQTDSPNAPEDAKLCRSTSQRTIRTVTEKTGNPLRGSQTPSPIELAAMNGHLETVMYLLQTLAVLGHDTQPVVTKCFTRAEEHHHNDLAEALRRCRGWTALHFCCANGDRDNVAWLLRAGAEPYAVDCQGATPRDLAHGGGHSPVVGVLDRAVLWCPESHGLFPAPFRHAIRHLLLVYGRMDGGDAWVPPEVWLAVLAYLPRPSSSKGGEVARGMSPWHSLRTKTTHLASASKRVLLQGKHQTHRMKERCSSLRLLPH